MHVTQHNHHVPELHVSHLWVISLCCLNPEHNPNPDPTLAYTSSASITITFCPRFRVCSSTARLSLIPSFWNAPNVHAGIPASDS